MRRPRFSGRRVSARLDAAGWLLRAEGPPCSARGPEVPAWRAKPPERGSRGALGPDSPRQLPDDSPRGDLPAESLRCDLPDDSPRDGSLEESPRNGLPDDSPRGGLPENPPRGGLPAADPRGRASPDGPRAGLPAAESRVHRLPVPGRPVAPSRPAESSRSARFRPSDPPRPASRVRPAAGLPPRLALPARPEARDPPARLEARDWGRGTARHYHSSRRTEARRTTLTAFDLGDESTRHRAACGVERCDRGHLASPGLWNRMHRPGIPSLHGAANSNPPTDASKFSRPRLPWTAARRSGSASGAPAAR
jgi:hypothetical protein